MKSTILLISFLIIGAGCSSSHYTVSSSGDQAVIFLKNNNDLECELISLQDSTLIISPRSGKTFNYQPLPDNYYYLKLEDIDFITVHGYNSEGWTTAVIMFQAVPAVLLAIAAASEEASAVGVFAISSIPAIITTLLFLGTEQDNPGIKNGNNYSDFEEIRIYCRYPEELENHEIRTLLKLSNQKTLRQYKF